MKIMEFKRLPETSTLNDVSRLTAQFASLVCSSVHQDLTIKLAFIWEQCSTWQDLFDRFRLELIDLIKAYNLHPFDVHRVLMSYSEVFKEDVGVAAQGDEELEKVARAEFDSITKGVKGEFKA